MLLLWYLGCVGGVVLVCGIGIMSSTVLLGLVIWWSSESVFVVFGMCLSMCGVRMMSTLELGRSIVCRFNLIIAWWVDLL